MKRSPLLVDNEEGSRERLSTLWESASSLKKGSRFEKLRHLIEVVLTNVRNAPLATFLTLSSTVISLLILCLFLVVAINCESGVQSSSQSINASIYIKEGTATDVLQTLVKKAAGFREVRSSHLRDKKEALSAFTQMVGAESPLLVGIGDKNPLPVSIEVSFAKEAIATGQYERVINDFENIPHVALVKVHNGDLSKLSQAVHKLRQFSLVATIFMIAVCGLLIANAIRLTVYANRDELEIMQLVGARRRYMQLPYIFEGFIFGLVGSVVAISFTRIIFIWLENIYMSSPLGELSGEPLQFFSPLISLGVLLLGASIGAASSLIATSGVRYEAAR